jgi:hypothetical protein
VPDRFSGESKAGFMCECGAGLCDARISMSGREYDTSLGPVLADGHGRADGVLGSCAVCGRPTNRPQRRKRR